jgi:hypothetical protein
MLIRIAMLLIACGLLAACGSKTAQTSPTTTTSATTTTAATATAATTTAPAAGPGALQAEVAATSAGDIPDNQVFVVYPGKAFTMKFPEGWAQTGSGTNVTFRDKNNIVRVAIVPGSKPTVTTVRQELATLKGARVTGTPTPVTINGLSGVKVIYESRSAPNAVTGKRVTLSVDRYELAGGGKRVIADLGSPVGVDNVDGYRLMIQSLRLK